MIYRFALFALLLSTLVSQAPVAEAQNRLRVVATFSIVGELVKNVGGDRIQLTTLVGPDGDTERFEPAPADARALRDAQVVFENGLGSEPWLDRLYEASGSRAPRIRVSQGVELLNAERDELDPHFWHDVANSIRVVQTIRDGLAGVDEANATAYSTNLRSYQERLQTLDAWVVAELSRIPENRRKLVTSHDTFGYFAVRYGFQIVGVGLDSFFTDAQPSAQQVADLVRRIRAAGVPAVFIENVTDPRLMQQIANEAGVSVAPALYTDALGPAGSPGATYVEMITHNVQTMTRSLTQ